MSRSARLLLVSGIALILAFTCVRAWVSWGNYSAIDATAGVWTALAVDFSEGEFYRPLFSDVGFGGTRYFPLFFTLHGVLIAAGLPAVPAGLTLSLLAVAALLVAVFRLLRKLHVPTLFAISGSAVLLASTAVHQALTSVRGDAAAAAFLVLGLGSCLDRRARSIWIAAAFFTLAFATKVTALYGAGAGFLCLLLAGRGRDAWRLAGATGAGVTVTLGTMHLASGGRVLGIMAACGSAGLGLTDLLKAPTKMLYFMTHLDTGALLTFFLAVIAVLGMAWSTRRGPGGVLLVAAVGAVTVIYASPGTNYNQLVDVQVASIVAFMAWVFEPARARPRLAATALTAVLFVSIHPLVVHLRNVDSAPLHRGYARIVATLGDVQGPILAENPVIPAMAGRPAWMIDPFMFRVLIDRDREFGDPLFEAMERRSIGAVVLSHVDPRTVWGGRRLREAIFGEGFAEALERNYELAHDVEGQLVYLPRSP